ncbi:MAG: hypothetical protein UT50_C0013G0013 [Candidatus Moranbacteria bacterium GW2011_GWA2_39_41]|nr:MAG: hypothetical protein UT50_C0013G0013 [Candidatus Moranbacteria bacterium GW2011_GWA2_39_41]
MEIKNKFEKLLFTITGLLAMALIVFGIKIKEDDKKIATIQNDLSDISNSIGNSLNMQKQTMASREALLDKIAAAPAPYTTKAVTTQVVVPGKVVPQQVPVTSNVKSGATR